MDIITYFEEYHNLKAYFNNKNFIYQVNFVKTFTLWNRESEKRQMIFSRFRDKYTFENFHELLISTFINNSKTYFMKLETPENLQQYKRYKIYWSNPLYYFKKDLENIDAETEDLINIETRVLLDNYFNLSDDSYEENRIVYDKYFCLCFNNPFLVNIKTDESIQNLIKKITGELQQ
jgi:hypothetical protein